MVKRMYPDIADWIIDDVLGKGAAAKLDRPARDDRRGFVVTLDEVRELPRSHRPSPVDGYALAEIVLHKLDPSDDPEPDVLEEVSVSMRAFFGPYPEALTGDRPAIRRTIAGSYLGVPIAYYSIVGTGVMEGAGFEMLSIGAEDPSTNLKTNHGSVFIDRHGFPNGEGGRIHRSYRYRPRDAAALSELVDREVGFVRLAHEAVAGMHYPVN